MKRFTSISLPLIVIVCSMLCLACVGVQARVPKIKYYSSYSTTVGGEPGEDPHLRIVSRVKIEYVFSTTVSMTAEKNDCVDNYRPVFGGLPRIEHMSETSRVNILLNILLNAYRLGLQP